MPSESYLRQNDDDKDDDDDDDDEDDDDNDDLSTCPLSHGRNPQS